MKTIDLDPSEWHHNDVALIDPAESFWGDGAPATLFHIVKFLWTFPLNLCLVFSWMPYGED